MTEKSNANRALNPKNIPFPPSVTRRIDRLYRRRFVREAAGAARSLGLSAWIVGGAVRDLWLNLPALDVDIAVAGDVESLARDLSRRGVGRLVTLSQGPPQVFRLARRGTQIDLAQLERGSIEADLGRRDFTANAVALPLSGGEPVDPFGGMKDLARRRLRAVNEKNFEDDPLRSLRAARFLATLGLVPDRALQGICRRAAPGLARVAPERIRTELAKLLEASLCAPALAWAAKTGLLSPALGLEAPGPARRRIARRRVAFDAPAVRRLGADGRRQARLALLAAALGLAAHPAGRWLKSRRWGREDAAAATRLLELAREAGAARTPEAQWRWVRDAGPHAPEALALLTALSPAGRRCSSRLRRRFAAARRGPRLRGSDVLAWLDLPPGPVVGKLLAALEIAGLSGRVRTRAEARKWLAVRAPAIIGSS
jgi:tRNA nucleotidyltransferase/poly(A) polymerase